MTVKEVLDWGTAQLRAAVPCREHGGDARGSGDEARLVRLDAQVLLASAMGMARERLYIEAGREVPSDRLFVFTEMIRRRASGEPMQYITGTREFMSLDFAVRPGVLIPRPETEILVELALDFLTIPTASIPSVSIPSLSVPTADAVRLQTPCGRRSVSRLNTASPLISVNIADIGTGSGAIIVSIAAMIRKNGLSNTAGLLVATDISEAALEIARDNAKNHGVDDKVTFLQGDMYDPFAEKGLDGMFNAILSNPPYITAGEIEALPIEVQFEPHVALYGGVDGLDYYRVLTHGAARFLKPGGFLAVEVGAGQAQDVLSLMRGAGLVDCGVRRDLASIERVVWGFRDAAPER